MKAITIVFTSAMITAAALKGVPALAEPVAAPERVVSLVQTADLDLASRDGQLQLDRRIARAAIEVCGTASPADLAGTNDVAACRADAVAKAKAASTQILAAAARGATIAVTAAR
jgi:UrcA family protein